MRYFSEQLQQQIINFVNKRYHSRAHGKVVGFIGDHISSRILAKGFYELDELEALHDYMISNGRPLKLFVDIGANIGNHTLFFANKFEAILAIEPDPIIFKVLELNTLLSGSDSIEIYNVAASSTQGDVKFQRAATQNQGTGKVVSLQEQQGLISVPAVRADDILKDKAEPSLIKLDVEGYERQVLLGMKHTLENTDAIIAFEANSIEDYIETSEYLKKFGYSHFSTFAYGLSGLPKILRVFLRIVTFSKKKWQRISTPSPLCISDLIIASKKNVGGI